MSGEIFDPSKTPGLNIESFLSEARRDFLFYLKATDPKYTLSKVHVYLAKKLQAVAERKIKRLTISVPPRVGKSRAISNELPLWLMGNHTAEQIACVGYSYDFITENASAPVRAKMRDNAMYHKIFPNCQLVEGDGKIGSWATSNGNRFRAMGIGGPLSGRGVSVLLIDDPYKDYESAHSEVTREKVWNWFLSTAFSRLEPTEYGDGVIVILHTRWHKEDLIGRIQMPDFKKRLDDAGIKDENKWEHINIPALAEENDPLGRNEGEPVFPEKFPLEKWNEIKATQDPYIWASMYCGNPVQKGGNNIMIDRISKVAAAPAGLHWVRFWDLACGVKQKNDWTVGVMGARDPSTGIMYLKDGIRIKAKWPDAREKIKDTAIKEAVPVGVEAQATFMAAFDDLQTILPPDILVTRYECPTDKMVRALKWTAMVRNYKVQMVEGDWCKDFLLEYAAFPDGTHDDTIDATSGLHKMIFEASSYIAPVNTKYSDTLSRRRSRSLEG